MEEVDIAIIGAGAAGCFAATICGELVPSKKILILEKTRQPLAKVRISGGGRCNVTHHCFEIPKLTTHYPRGAAFLRNGFARFQPKDMVDWLEQRGVELKIEKDGRMFPVTNKSETIIQCFLNKIKEHGIELRLESELVSLSKILRDLFSP